MGPISIFEELQSRIENIITENRLNKKWGGSVCATPIQVGETLLIGINWGGGGLSDKYEYEIQKSMPSFEEFKELYKNGDYRFLKRIKPFAEKYCQIDVSEGKYNYSNLCFFRTPGTKDLIDKNFELSMPIFRSMIEYIMPKQIISLGTGNIKYLKKYFQEKFQIGNPILISGTSHKIYSGKLLKSEFYNLPHPSAHRLSNETYDMLWKTLFEHKI